MHALGLRVLTYFLLSYLLGGMKKLLTAKHTADANARGRTDCSNLSAGEIFLMEAEKEEARQTKRELAEEARRKKVKADAMRQAEAKKKAEATKQASETSNAEATRKANETAKKEEPRKEKMEDADTALELGHAAGVGQQHSE